MSDPYEVLGLPRDADDEALRLRYLELVREHPPDRSPERFAAIRAAYDAVRDPSRRLEDLLLHVGSTDSIAAMTGDLRARIRSRIDRVPVADLLHLADSR
ncbi:J domain-containing protein [Tautonia sp. JC769]|uniref:J domain-containing protein n=1 Tax=Tautonia sp. JC769 TaxID=3232135 RepID=UPI0034590471